MSKGVTGRKRVNILRLTRNLEYISFLLQCTPCREGVGWMMKIMHRFGR